LKELFIIIDFDHVDDSFATTNGRFQFHAIHFQQEEKGFQQGKS